MNIQMLLKQANQMQAKIQKAQKLINEKEYEETVGGNAVKLVVKGSLEVKSCTIDQDLLEKDNKEMIEELITMAFNNVVTRIQNEKDQANKEATGGMKLPGVF